MIVIILVSHDYFLGEWTILYSLTIGNQEDYYRTVCFMIVSQYIELLDINITNFDYVHIHTIHDCDICVALFLRNENPHFQREKYLRSSMF